MVKPKNNYNQKSKNNRYNKNAKDRKPMSDATYRFRRVLGEILKYLKSIPHRSDFETCKDQYEQQVTEIMNRGFTWGYSYPIPVHDSDFKSLQKKEWATIRAIVRKQDYQGSNPTY